MGIFIGLAVSLIGSYFYDIDFCTLYTFVAVALDIYKELQKYTKD